jgi:hypothetical protein
MNNELIEILKQILADVKDAQNTGNLGLLYERMLANAEDIESQLKEQV